MKQKPVTGRTQAESNLIRAAREYAKALRDAMLGPTPENNRVLLLTKDAMFLAAAQLLPEDELKDMAKAQYKRVMKDG